ncbi:MAG: MgtC/SapB family protein [Spirochaetaceae bacterium]|jgi:putative Mg2+ transporter-C (MgtC) family protein|nr:MgtC/SapB family protein [Spirochaetaceae bacterium]
MDILKAFFVDPVTAHKLTMANALLRILLSFFAGFIIGFVREKRRQPAGLRTHILISVASSLIMMVSVTIASTVTADGTPTVLWYADGARIASQVVSGIGFLGAGVILKQGINIRGLTSAATIWAISAIGLAIGIGLYIPAFTTLGVFLLVLIFVERFEKRYMPSKEIRQLDLQYHAGGQDIREIIQALKSAGIIVTEYSLSTSLQSGKTSVYLLISFRGAPDTAGFANILAQTGELEKLRLLSVPSRFGT